MNTTDAEVIARITFHDAADWDADTVRSVQNWLRYKAKQLGKEHKQYARRFTARAYKEAN